MCHRRRRRYGAQEPLLFYANSGYPGRRALVAKAALVSRGPGVDAGAQSREVLRYAVVVVVGKGELIRRVNLIGEG